MAFDIFARPFQALGKRCEFVAAGCTEREANRWFQTACKAIESVQEKFNRHNDKSLLSLIHRQAGKHAIDCDLETITLLSQSAWLLPDITLGERSVFIEKASGKLDVEPFLSAYAADRAASILQSKSMRFGYLNLAGETRFLGTKPDQSPWHIGIYDPDDATKLLARVPMYAGAISTSSGRNQLFKSLTVVADTAFEANQIRLKAVHSESGSIQFLQASGKPFLAVDALGQITSAQ
jgi:thiamine biosynthesis lipoprotein